MYSALFENGVQHYLRSHSEQRQRATEVRYVERVLVLVAGKAGTEAGPKLDRRPARWVPLTRWDWCFNFLDTISVLRITFQQTPILCTSPKKKKKSRAVLHAVNGKYKEYSQALRPRSTRVKRTLLGCQLLDHSRSSVSIPRLRWLMLHQSSRTAFLMPATHSMSK